jgi:hypothetical protein
MAHLDDILNKYVKPGAEAQGLQASAFIVKDKNGSKSRPIPQNRTVPESLRNFREDAVL